MRLDLHQILQSKSHARLPHTNILQYAAARRGEAQIRQEYKRITGGSQDKAQGHYDVNPKLLETASAWCLHTRHAQQHTGMSSAENTVESKALGGLCFPERCLCVRSITQD
jgi:hypothetical protein